MTALRLFFARHPLGWRLWLTSVTLGVALLFTLYALDWPSLTQAGALRRLARENATTAGEIVASGNASPARARGVAIPRPWWVLGYDGARYQVALLERCAGELLWRPHYRGRISYLDEQLPFQVVAPTAAQPLQYCTVYTRGLPSESTEVTTGTDTETEHQNQRFCLIFSKRDLSRVEVFQATTASWEEEPDWSAVTAEPMAAEPLLGGVWQITLTEPDPFRSDVPLYHHQRVVGYDKAGNAVEGVPAVPPSFA